MMTWTPEETKEHRRLWVEALRSGKYRQAIGDLRSDDGFCCLGVGCDISGLGHWEDTRYITPDFRHEGTLETDVQEWLGLAGMEGEYWETSLARLNDNDKKTLAEIADIIESEPEGLLAPVAGLERVG
jgi:hypothetical protein